MPFVIRNQGFFYTDEYFAPADVFRKVLRSTFPTREAAEGELVKHCRKWIAKVRLADYLFDEVDEIRAVVAYLREQWPDEIRGDYLGDIGGVPEGATDEQLDTVLRLSRIVPARVFEVKKGEREPDDDGELAFEPIG